ncbi:MAG TPA: hypothetical protein VFV94_13685 [Polyangiaceae bacterium]|nr:hypothetical protein [Polyangiaceae bacterium]
MKRFLVGTVALGAALAVVGCSGKSSGDDDDGGAGGESGASGGSAGKTQAGGTGKAGTGGAKGDTGGNGNGGSAGKAVGGSAGTSGSGGASGGGGVSGQAGSGMGGIGRAGDGGTPEMPGGSGGNGGEPSHDVGPPQQGSCTAPCQLELAPTGDLPGDSAVLVYDFETGTATLTSDADTSVTSDWVIGFSFETDPQHGYGAWGRNQWWFAFTKPLVYVDGTYSMAQDVDMTSQMINPETDQTLLVTYSYGEHTVRILDVRVPACSDAQGGACTGAADCPAVEGGILRADAEVCERDCNASASCETTCLAEDGGISAGCAGCYVEFLDCVTTECTGNGCPSQGGNACMNCEVEHCSDAFMSCSGLDYMPRGTLTWPLYVPPT